VSIINNPNPKSLSTYVGVVTVAGSEEVTATKSHAGLKGTGPPDGLGFRWHIWIDLGLKKGRGWFLNSLGLLPLFIEILVFLAVIAIVSWLIKLAANFCQSLLFTGRVYCSMIKVDWLTDGVLLRELAHCLQILPANKKLGLEADEISQTLLTNRMQRKLQDH
jgi:hypothetical protein